MVVLLCCDAAECMSVWGCVCLLGSMSVGWRGVAGLLKNVGEGQVKSIAAVSTIFVIGTVLTKEQAPGVAPVWCLIS